MSFKNKTAKKEMKMTREAKFRTYVICAFLMLVSSGGAEVKAC